MRFPLSIFLWYLIGMTSSFLYLPMFQVHVNIEASHRARTALYPGTIIVTVAGIHGVNCITAHMLTALPWMFSSL
jgi:hypothetical protein